MALTQASLGMLDTSSAVGLTFRNRIINGDMRIAQRGTTAITIDNGNWYYAVDRTCGYGSVASSKYSLQQNAGSVTPPAGFTNYIGATVTSAYTPVTTDWFVVRQSIEGYNVADLQFGTSNAKPVAVSFWVRSSLTGTMGGHLCNTDGTRSYPFTYTINSANTWEYKTFTAPGDTAGTWPNTNGTGLILGWSMGAGPSYTGGTAGSWNAGYYVAGAGSTNIVATNGATLYITGVQLEAGTQPTAFERRSYGTELALCQRYNIRFGSPFDTTARFVAAGYGGGGTTSGFVLQYPVSMRAAPAMSYSLGSGLSVNNGSAAYAASAVSANLINKSQAGLAVTQSTSVTNQAISFYSTSTDFYVNLDAEL